MMLGNISLDLQW